MSSVSRDSGLLDCKRANDNKRKLEAALQELIEASVLMRYESDETREGRSALKDIKFSLYPDHDFVAEQKRSNQTKISSRRRRSVVLPRRLVDEILIKTNA